MESLKDWNFYYREARNHLNEGDLRSAFNKGMTCWQIIGKTFNSCDDPGQIYVLKLFYKTIRLVLGTNKGKSCKGCARTQYQTAKDTLLSISKNSYYSTEVQNRANFYLSKLERDNELINKGEFERFFSSMMTSKNHLRLVN